MRIFTVLNGCLQIWDKLRCYAQISNLLAVDSSLQAFMRIFSTVQQPQQLTYLNVFVQMQLIC